MNKNILKIVLIGVAAGFCISAKATPEKRSQEKTVAQCDKNNCKKKPKKKCSGSCQTNNSYNTTERYDGVRNNYSNDEHTFSSHEVALKRKSAAQKVMEGY